MGSGSWGTTDTRSVDFREIVSVEAGEGWHGSGQETACNCLRMFRFQTAPVISGASLDGDMPAGLAHPIGCAGAVMSLQGGERPVRVGQHVDAALRADQDGDIRRNSRFGSSFRRFQDRLGVFEKCPHTGLIGPGVWFWRKFGYSCRSTSIGLILSTFFAGARQAAITTDPKITATAANVRGSVALT